MKIFSRNEILQFKFSYLYPHIRLSLSSPTLSSPAMSSPPLSSPSISSPSSSSPSMSIPAKSSVNVQSCNFSVPSSTFLALYTSRSYSRSAPRSERRESMPNSHSRAVFGVIRRAAACWDVAGRPLSTSINAAVLHAAPFLRHQGRQSSRFKFSTAADSSV